MNTPHPGEITPEQIKKFLRGGWLWSIIAIVLVALVAVTTVRLDTVRPDEVGLLLNRLTGEVKTLSNGIQPYNGLLSQFFVLDNTLQTLDMTQETGRGDRRGRDDLKIKTVDGSDVYVDVKVMYRIIPEMAAEVLRTSGPGVAFKQKWARDFTRAICREFLGELTTEGFYDAARRDEQMNKAKLDINRRLQPYGLKVDNILIPRRPQFYKDYEAMIKRKKLADQGAQEEQSKALAAKQKQQTLVVEETNKKNVAVEEYEGAMSQLMIAAEAEANRARKEADAYYARLTVAAEATLYKMEKGAEATLAEKKAEAKGLMALKEALEGEGGPNMVKLEYARRLRDVQISGQPFTREGNTQRMEHRMQTGTSHNTTGGAE